MGYSRRLLSASEIAAAYLPARISSLIEGGLWCDPDEIDEIRLRRAGPFR